MATTPRQETAQIFQFPVPSRRSSAGPRTRQPESWPMPPVAMSDFGSGWYHEAAMEQAEEPHKH